MKKEINVVGAIIIKDEKILCAQRGNTKALASLWEFPGGKIEEGETPREALERELVEEIRIEVAVAKTDLKKTKKEEEKGQVN